MNSVSFRCDAVNCHVSVRAQQGRLHPIETSLLHVWQGCRLSKWTRPLMPASQDDACQPPQVPACMLPGSMKAYSMGRHVVHPKTFCHEVRYALAHCLTLLCLAAPGVSVGTQLLAPLNTVHVKYRGFFKDDYKSCCSKPLREVGMQPAGQPPAVQHICSPAGASSRGNPTWPSLSSCSIASVPALGHLAGCSTLARLADVNAALHQCGSLLWAQQCTSKVKNLSMQRRAYHPLAS